MEHLIEESFHYVWPPYHHSDFHEMDKDGDGQLSREEVIAMRGSDKGFDEADKDGDGKLSKEESLHLDDEKRHPELKTKTKKEVEQEWQLAHHSVPRSRP